MSGLRGNTALGWDIELVTGPRSLSPCTSGAITPSYAMQVDQPAGDNKRAQAWLTYRTVASTDPPFCFTWQFFVPHLTLKKGRLFLHSVCPTRRLYIDLRHAKWG